MWGIAKGAGQIVRMSFHVLQESFICTWMRRFTEICDSHAVGRKRFGSDRVDEASIMSGGKIRSAFVGGEVVSTKMGWPDHLTSGF